MTVVHSHGAHLVRDLCQQRLPPVEVPGVLAPNHALLLLLAGPAGARRRRFHKVPQKRVHVAGVERGQETLRRDVHAGPAKLALGTEKVQDVDAVVEAADVRFRHPPGGGPRPRVQDDDVVRLGVGRFKRPVRRLHVERHAEFFEGLLEAAADQHLAGRPAAPAVFLIRADGVHRVQERLFGPGSRGRPRRRWVCCSCCYGGNWR